MSITFIGKKFNIKDPWGPQEHYIIKTVVNQITKTFPTTKNLVVNMTWFGPAFKNSSWDQVQDLIKNGITFENLFWLSPVDPLCVLSADMQQIEKDLAAKKVFYIGTGFNGPMEFNTGALACLEEFPDYSLDDLKPSHLNYVFMCYNRKPKPHRIRLVDMLFECGLNTRGIITLGDNDVNYDVTEGMPLTRTVKINDNPANYTKNGYFNLHTSFGGVPYDLSSLGRLDLWQQCFLNIVSETEFREWDNRFVTEKIWKPIIGLRPFVINGQVKIYQWLRDQGFRTFNHYFPVDIENRFDDDVQVAIVDVVRYLSSLEQDKLTEMFDNMLPDLIHNRNRFFEFAKEQKHKIENLF